MDHTLTELDISILDGIVNEDPSFDLTSALFKFRDDIQKRKRLSASRTKMLYDLLKNIHWRIDIEGASSSCRIAISARIDGKEIPSLQDKIISVTESMLKPINHNDKTYHGVNVYTLGYIHSDRRSVDTFIADLRMCEQTDPYPTKKGFIHY